MSLRRSARPWRAEVHWRAAGGGMNHATVTLDTLPLPFGIFEHPDVAEGRRLQIRALSVDERQRCLRVDLP